MYRAIEIFKILLILKLYLFFTKNLEIGKNCVDSNYY